MRGFFFHYEKQWQVHTNMAIANLVIHTLFWKEFTGMSMSILQYISYDKMRLLVYLQIDKISIWNTYYSQNH